jgi:hypothetical protein
MSQFLRRSAHSPLVIRHFEFNRHQNQSITLAYQALIPVASRPMERPRSRSHDNQPATTTRQGRPSKARGA